MDVLTEMDLPLLPAEQAEFSANPWPFVDEARGKHPWLARSNVGGYIIHGYQAAKDIIYMDDKLRPYFDGVAEFYGAESTPWGHFMSEMMLARHGAVHTRLREASAEAFTPRNINRYRALMREVVSELLDNWAPKGRFDFCDFAAHFPISVFCGLLGVSREIVPSIRDLLETQAQSTQMNPALLPAMLKGFDGLWHFADTVVKEFEAKGGGDGGSLLDVLIKARNAGKTDDVEIRQNIIMFAAGGYDTSKNMLGLIMQIMLERPDDWERCAEDIRFCTRVVEEALRHSSISSVYRAVSEEFDYGGVRFPKDSVLFILVGLASRDPSVIPDAEEFNPDRVQTNRHIGFGRGVHMCIGQHLAKAQIEESLHIIAQRLRNPRLAGTVAYRPYLGIWGLKSLPIEFDPAPGTSTSLA